jgi:MiaB-like tRNA modifying enzyme
MKVYLETYGCTANKGDSELILGQLAQLGFTCTSNLLEADLVIVNTCAVKGVTYRRMKSRLLQLKKLGKKVLVAGCLPLIDPHGLDGFSAISCRSIPSLPEVLSRIERGEENVRILYHPFVEKPLLPRIRLQSLSAIVQIEEGCLSNCSYCSVKLARGSLRSFLPENLERVTREAIKEGAKEILLTGQDTAVYGRDIGTDLPSLIQRLSTLPGNFRIRVGMMNPRYTLDILPSLLNAYESPKVYKFLHLPLQSGDNQVLKDMRRGYTVENFERIVSAFRERFPDLQLVTDIIVGFPTENQEAFERTCELLKKLEPDKVNISKFSPMPRTDAARLKQLSSQVIASRSRIMTNLCRQIAMEVNRRYLGRTMKVLVVERGPRGGFLARACNYKPVILRDAKIGEEVEIKVVDAKPTHLIGEII